MGSRRRKGVSRKITQKATADIAVAGWRSYHKELIVAAAVHISECTISQKGGEVWGRL
jgi:hypothetical protein